MFAQGVLRLALVPFGDPCSRYFGDVPRPTSSHISIISISIIYLLYLLYYLYYNTSLLYHLSVSIISIIPSLLYHTTEQERVLKTGQMILFGERVCHELSQPSLKVLSTPKSDILLSQTIYIMLRTISVQRIILLIYYFLPLRPEPCYVRHEIERIPANSSSL